MRDLSRDLWSLSPRTRTAVSIQTALVSTNKLGPYSGGISDKVTNAEYHLWKPESTLKVVRFSSNSFLVRIIAREA